MFTYIIIRAHYKVPQEYWNSTTQSWSLDEKDATTYAEHLGEAVIARLRLKGESECLLASAKPTHNQIVFSCGVLLGIAARVESGGGLDAEDIAFMKKFSADVMANEDAGIKALKAQEHDAGLAAIHAASWRPPE
jgi:hypothetical protein